MAFPDANSHARHDMARQSKIDHRQQTARIESLSRLAEQVLTDAKRAYEEDGEVRLENFYDFCLPELSDYTYTPPVGFDEELALAKDLTSALDVLLNRLFDSNELNFFVHEINVRGEKATLHIDIWFHMRD